MRTRKLPDGRLKALVQGLRRGTIVEFMRDRKLPSVQVADTSDIDIANEVPQADALVRAVREP